MKPIRILFWINRSNIIGLPKNPGKGKKRQHTSPDSRKLTEFAKKLTHFVFKNEKLDWKKDFTLYHHMLLEEVINIEDIRYRFYDKFIDAKTLYPEKLKLFEDIFWKQC
jgi:hypothetical protein